MTYLRKSYSPQTNVRDFGSLVGEKSGSGFKITELDIIKLVIRIAN